MVSCLLCQSWKLFPLDFNFSLFFSHYLQEQLHSPLVKFWHWLSSVACVNQTVASLEVFIMKDSVALISDPYSCTSTSSKSLLAIFPYAPFVVSVQISAIFVMMTGQILMINMQKVVDKAVGKAVLWNFPNTVSFHISARHWNSYSLSSNALSRFAPLYFSACSYLVSITIHISQQYFYMNAKKLLMFGFFLSICIGWC